MRKLVIYYLLVIIMTISTSALCQVQYSDPICFGERWQKTEIRCLVEHPNGLTYIGTTHGVYVYNGDIMDSLNIPEIEINDITRMEIDKAGNFYLTLGSFGIASFNVIDNTWQTTSSSNSSHRYTSLSVHDDFIIYGSTEGLTIYNRKSEQSYYYIPMDDLPTDHYTSTSNPNKINVILRQDSILWCATPGGLLKFSLSTKKFEAIVTPFKNYFIKTSRHFNIENMLLYNDIIYMATWGGDLQSYNTSSKKWNRHMRAHETADSGSVISVAILNDEELIYSRARKEPLTINFNSNQINQSFISSKFYRLFVDRYGHLFGQRSYKVCRYKPSQERILRPNNLYIHNLIIGNKIVHASIVPILEKIINISARQKVSMNISFPHIDKVSKLFYRISKDDGWYEVQGQKIEFIAPGGHFDLSFRSEFTDGSEQISNMYFRDVALKETSGLGMTPWIVGAIILLGIGSVLFFRNRKKSASISQNVPLQPEKFENKILKVRTAKENVSIIINEIIYCKADSNYCHVITIDNEYLFSKTLKYIQGQLPENQFLRVHNSYLINTQFIERYIYEDNSVHLKHNHTIPVSRRMQSHFK